MTIKALLLIQILVFLQLACTKTETIEVEKISQVEVPRQVEVPVTVPGKTETITVTETMVIDQGIGVDSLPIEIEKASAREQEIGKAVVRILGLLGDSGTGFFISEDGLLLTNEHVLSRESCFEGGCPGYKLIQHFQKSGNVRQYTDFEVIAQGTSHDGLDFTLIQVKLKENEKVPFIPLELDSTHEALDLTEESKPHRYKIFGHPSGSTLRVTHVKPFSKRNADIDFKGVIIPGNSGGPLVDLETGKAVGLVKQVRSGFNKHNEKTAIPYNHGRATALSVLAEGLRSNLSKVSESKASKLTKMLGSGGDSSTQKNLIVSPRAREILQSIPAEMFQGALSTTPESFRSFLVSFFYFLGRGEETKILDSMINFSGKAFHSDSLLKILQVQYLIGRPLRFSDQAKSKVAAFLETEMSQGKFNNGILYSEFNEKEKSEIQKKCLERVKSQPSVVSAIYVCFSTRGSDGQALLPEALKFFQTQKYSHVDDFGSLTAFFMFLQFSHITDAEDFQTMAALNQFVEERQKDLSFSLQNDSFAMGILKGISGRGSFSSTVGAH